MVKLGALAASLVLLTAPMAAAGPKGYGKAGHQKLDRTLQARSAQGLGESRVIVELVPNAPDGVVRGLGGVEGRRLRTFPGQVARIGNRKLQALANSPWVTRVHVDRRVSSSMERAGLMTGARTVQQVLGYTGAGVGVAVIDSGVTSWHDDLMGSGLGGQKVARFVDFVQHGPHPYDDNGHGTHVAGIIAGSGYDSNGERAGVAPGAHLVSLKVLDQFGGGYMSDVIAALDWVATNHAAYNVRVVNLSVGAAVTESYNTDPLTLAARRVVEAGVVVVAAAGNLGRNAVGQTLYGGITAPANAPWVLTVGASSHMGTLWRGDDTMAGYSSRGPTAVDYLSKPDLVAPGTGIVSLSDPNSYFYTAKAAYLLDGTLATTYKPYLSLTGTSMAAPVVTGSVALMLQANPALTPNAVKAILQYTSQVYFQYNHLTQGAGFLNTRDAVGLAAFFRHARPGDRFPTGPSWSRHVIWGNHRLAGGMIMPTANAWATNIVWGATRDGDGDNIVWGTTCRLDADCDNIVWGSTARDGENIVWGNDTPLDNIVWGNSVDTDGDGVDDNIVWGSGSDDDNIVWGNSCDPLDPLCDNIVWGNAFGADDENIVWGNDCDGRDCDNIVWGSSACDPLDPLCDNIVWGSAAADNVVWGNSLCDPLDPDCDNIVWGNNLCDPLDPDCDNIVWGNSADDNVVWGTADDDNVVWGNSLCDSLDPDCDNIVWGNSVTDGTSYTDPVAAGPALFDDAAFYALFSAEPPAPPPPPIVPTCTMTTTTLVDPLTGLETTSSTTVCATTEGVI